MNTRNISAALLEIYPSRKEREFRVIEFLKDNYGIDFPYKKGESVYFDFSGNILDQTTGKTVKEDSKSKDIIRVVCDEFGGISLMVIYKNGGKV